MRKLNPAVREHLAGSSDLRSFLATAGELTPDQRKLIVEQALILLEQNYAHLPLKRAMHSVDPVQRLRLLQQTLDLGHAVDQPSESDFHREMTDIFTSVRDLHTNYLLPAPFNSRTAFLPFMVEDYVDGGVRRYIVSHVAEGFHHPTFKPGVRLVHWNGTPIERAVWSHAQRFAGSNREARHARGVQTLTTRSLILAPPPDEEWVIVGYETPEGPNELRFDWMVTPPAPAAAEPDAPGAEAARAALGVDLEQETIQRMRRVLFKPGIALARRKARASRIRRDAVAGLDSTIPHVFEARPVATPSGTFGYLRIRTFSHWPPQDFVAEFIRLISALPQNGLIIDVRGNGGGVIMNGELILQTLTPRRIEPEPVQFLNTPLNLQICRRNGPGSPWADLSAWVESMQQALQTGATFSAGFPISDTADCNAIGQKYFGPVVLIIDALCYSTTDIFAAGFQDHEIGPVLGTDGNTGAGGANVWLHQHLVDVVLPGANSVYRSLPLGAGMRVSMRRTLRVGRRAGMPVEDLGVVPDQRHELTRDDLLHRNIDLIARAALLLAARPARRLHVTVQPTSSTRSAVTVETQGMDRLDVFERGRPYRSLDVQDGQTMFSVDHPPGPSPALEIRGFAAGELVARSLTGN